MYEHDLKWHTKMLKTNRKTEKTVFFVLKNNIKPNIYCCDCVCVRTQSFMFLF